jgi:hypothetical protein
MGDRATEYFGAAHVVFFNGPLSLMGLLLAVIGHTTSAAMASVALFGLGMSCLAPLLLPSAGRKDPANYPLDGSNFCIPKLCAHDV